MIEVAEAKLLSILPDSERKKFLGFQVKPSVSDVSYAENELKKWQQNITEIDKELSNHHESHNDNTKTVNKVDKKKSLPPVRGSTSTSNSCNTNTTEAVVSDNIATNNDNENLNSASSNRFIPKFIDKRIKAHLSELETLRVKLKCSDSSVAQRKYKSGEHVQ